MAIDVCRARRETPGCQAVLHLNNAGAALMPQPVLRCRGVCSVKRFSAGTKRQNRRTLRSSMCTTQPRCWAVNAMRLPLWRMPPAPGIWPFTLSLGPGDRILHSDGGVCQQLPRLPASGA